MVRQEDYDLPPQRTDLGFWWEDEYCNPDFMHLAMPPSTWDERLLAHIDTHLNLEANAGSAYDAFAKMGDPRIRYLVGLFAADERRHHAMLSALATSVRSTVHEEGTELDWGKPPVLNADQREALLNETDRLLQIEKDDARELKAFRRDLRLAPDGTLWPILVEIMHLDTRKHIRILKAIRQRFQRG